MTCTALDLQPITCAAEAPVVVHGTYKKAWDSIKHQVLMYVHVHLCVCRAGITLYDSLRIVY